MSFIVQSAKILGKNLAELKFQAVLFGRDALYLEGAAPVKIDENEMIFKVYGSVVTVTGEKLAIKDLAGDCAAIVGAINGFSVKDL